jgi:hypothetical protein
MVFNMLLQLIWVSIILIILIKIICSFKRILATELKSNIVLNSYNSGSVFLLKMVKEFYQELRNFL